MRRVILAVLLSTAALLVAVPGVANAFTETAWYHLTSGARPTHLITGLGKDNVQEVPIVEPSGGFCLAEHTEAPASGIVCFAQGASAGTVQTGLQTTAYPGRALSVMREVVGGTARYVVTFPSQSILRRIGYAHTQAELEAGGEVSVTLAGGEAGGQVVDTVANLGDGAANGEGTPIAMADKLPPGLKAVSIEAFAGGQGGFSLGTTQCVLSSLSCTFTHKLPPYNQIEVRIGVVLEPGAKSGENTVTASGGEAAPVEISRPITLSTEPISFGAQNYEFSAEEEGGEADIQAGTHPFQVTTTLTLNQLGTHVTEGRYEVEPVELSKNLTFRLPAGLVGNATALPKCTLAEFAAVACPSNSAIGVALSTYDEPRNIGLNTMTTAVYNVEPAKGEPARFGFLPTHETPVLIDTSVRTGGDYGVNVKVSNIPQTISFLSSTVTLWGVPGATQHDTQRGEACLEEARAGGACPPTNEPQPPAFLSLPTSCTGSTLQTEVEMLSWNHREAVVTDPLAAMIGCDALSFSGDVAFTSEQSTSSTPGGFSLKVHVPQGAALAASGRTPSDVREMSFRFPLGVALNAAAAGGLDACTLEEIALSSAIQPSCPEAARIANVTVHTPLLPQPLKGFVYIASPQNFSGPPPQNPFESLFATYIVVSDPVSGVLVKLASKITLSESGQIEATVPNSPQLPFEDAEVEFYGGQRAPLSTPPRCGPYTTVGTVVPWSGGESSVSEPRFAVSAGPAGTPCPGATLPFRPTLSAGSTSATAGSFSGLTTAIGHNDGDQALSSAQLHFPAGVSGILTGVPLCPEASANAGTCESASKIGEASVNVGLGSTPYPVTGGQVYLTEKYAGAPFGLSIVTYPKAGPFVLQQGRPVIVRAKVEVDRTSGALTVTTGGIPQIIDGVPLQIKSVSVNVNRASFTFNPTSCAAKTITGVINGSEGAAAAVTEPFAVANCATLKFTPKLAAVTPAKGSKPEGTSLSVKLTYPKTPAGTEANIAMVKVDLPKQLPSRTSTLHKACLAAVFSANPANCAPESIVGHASVVTPLLPVPLVGPAYFVSHGGEAFPSLTMILQGYGITIELVGATFIRNGITSTTFRSTPDVPFTEFALTLPKGKFSALTAYGNLCKTALKMPTAFVAQNGAEIHGSNTIAVTGCPKATKKHKPRAKHKKK